MLIYFTYFEIYTDSGYNLISSVYSENSIILDFFSGSATTAHAVMTKNVSDEVSKKIKYILVQLPEHISEDKIAYKLGYRTIDQIGMDRIKKAAIKIKEKYPETTVDLGFKHYILKEPSQTTLDKLEFFNPEDNMLAGEKTILDEFGSATVIRTWLERDGYGLTVEPTKLNVSGYPVYYIDKHLYLINPDIPEKTIEELVVKYETDDNFNPENIVIFGYSFSWVEMEHLKINLKRLKNTEKKLNINFDIRY